MDKPIASGDLVRIVRKFCEAHDDHGLGLYFVVDSIVPAKNFACRRCFDAGGPTLTNGEALAIGDVGKGRGFYPVSCLRRVPPLEELDDVKRDEEITA